MSDSIGDIIQQHIWFLEERGDRGDEPTIGILRDAAVELERLWLLERDGKTKGKAAAAAAEKASLNPSECKSCQAPILWSTSKNGKPMPLDGDPETRAIISPATGRSHLVATYKPHWASCPHADQWKKSKR